MSWLSEAVKNGQPSMYLFDGGYASFNANGVVDGWHYYIQDYMGNNRMVVNKNGTVEQVTHYYPYGGVIGDIGTLLSDVTKGNNENLQEYKFEGKELDRTFGLDNYDIHARQYFAMAPIWDRIDSLAEKLPGVSPYVFCNGDPVNHVDKDGKWAETLWDIANVVMDVKSACDNFSNGNTKAGLVDVGAGIVDGLAAVLPFVPAGAGTALKVARAADGAKVAGKIADKSIDIAKSVVHGNSKLSTKAQHAYDIIDKRTNKVVKTGVSGGKIKNGKSVRAEAQVRKWNREEKAVVYESFITHYEPEGIGARAKILEYEKKIEVLSFEKRVN